MNCKPILQLQNQELQLGKGFGQKSIKNDKRSNDALNKYEGFDSAGIS